MTDFTVLNEGSVVVLTPVSDEGIDWATEYLMNDLTFGRGTVVEPRYMDPVLTGIAEAGLTWELV
jgi:hypothetical protein